MQSVSTGIWTRVTVSISCDDNHYTMVIEFIINVLTTNLNLQLKRKTESCLQVYFFLSLLSCHLFHYSILSFCSPLCWQVVEHTDCILSRVLKKWFTGYKTEMDQIVRVKKKKKKELAIRKKRIEKLRKKKETRNNEKERKKERKKERISWKNWDTKEKEMNINS